MSSAVLLGPSFPFRVQVLDITDEKSNCHTRLGPVGSCSNAALHRPARSGRCFWYAAGRDQCLVAQQPQHGVDWDTT